VVSSIMKWILFALDRDRLHDADPHCRLQRQARHVSYPASTSQVQVQVRVLSFCATGGSHGAILAVAVVVVMGVDAHVAVVMVRRFDAY
jgi:hypothetical protein